MVQQWDGPRRFASGGQPSGGGQQPPDFSIGCAARAEMSSIRDKSKDKDLPACQ